MILYYILGKIDVSSIPRSLIPASMVKIGQVISRPLTRILSVTVKASKGALEPGA